MRCAFEYNCRRTSLSASEKSLVLMERPRFTYAHARPIRPGVLSRTGWTRCVPLTYTLYQPRWGNLEIAIRTHIDGFRLLGLVQLLDERLDMLAPLLSLVVVPGSKLVAP